MKLSLLPLFLLPASLAQASECPEAVLPTVLLPAPGASDVPLNARVWVYAYARALVHVELSTARDGRAVPLTEARDFGSAVELLAFTPGALLEPDTEYRLEVSGPVIDSRSFRTGAAIDSTPPGPAPAFSWSPGPEEFCYGAISVSAVSSPAADELYLLRAPGPDGLLGVSLSGEIIGHHTLGDRELGVQLLVKDLAGQTATSAVERAQLSDSRGPGLGCRSQAAPDLAWLALLGALLHHLRRRR